MGSPREHSHYKWRQSHVISSVYERDAFSLFISWFPYCIKCFLQCFMVSDCSVYEMSRLTNSSTTYHPLFQCTGIPN